MKIFKGPEVTGEKGFTLVELLIVMAIIAVLVGITIAGLGFAMRRSRNVARMSAMNNLDRAVTAYYSDELAFPNPQGVDAMIGVGNDLDEYLEGSFEAPAGTRFFYNSTTAADGVTYVYYTFCVNQELSGGEEDLYECTGTGVGQSGMITTTEEVDCDGDDGTACGVASNCDADGCSPV